MSKFIIKFPYDNSTFDFLCQYDGDGDPLYKASINDQLTIVKKIKEGGYFDMRLWVDETLFPELEKI